MPRFRVEQYEIHVLAYEVESATGAEAINRVLGGLALPMDNSLEYVEIAEDYGLPTDEHRELADDLRSLGVPVGLVIPSVRSVERIE